MSADRSAACDRLVEVEAGFDGRLDAEAARGLDVHLGTCATCREEHAALARLRQTLRDATPEANTFAVKRLRRSLLLRAQGGDVAPPRVRPRLVRLLPLLAALFVAGIGFAAGVLYVRPSASEVSLVTGRGASYSTEDTADRHVVRITEGVFDFDVKERADGKRLLVVVPDGEIEDIGTRFRVVVANGVTTEVSVSEGEVELRRRGVAPVRLVAGMSYHPVPVDAPSRADVTPTVTPPTPTAVAVASAPPVSSPASPPAATPTAAASIASVARATPPKTNASSPRNGDDPAAPATTSRPSSSSSVGGVTPEDQAYLRVLQLMRDARDDEARAAANEYLARFPTGLRGKEMRAVAERR